jgi:hypothetical protein
MVLLWTMVVMAPVHADEVPFNTSVAGDRNLGQEYTWTVNNASGWADCVYHYTVYDYRIIGDKYTYFSPSWGLWFTQQAGPGKKYLAVWVRGWSEGTTYFSYGQNRFPLFVRDMTVYPDPVQLQDLEIGSIGSGRHLPVVIKELENNVATIERGQLSTERYGWKDEIELSRMEPGRSNAADGYVIYQVDQSASPEDIRAVGWFGYWGTAIWHLTNTTIDQKSIESEAWKKQMLFRLERAEGRRSADHRPTRARA